MSTPEGKKPERNPSLLRRSESKDEESLDETKDASSAKKFTDKPRKLSSFRRSESKEEDYSETKSLLKKTPTQDRDDDKKPERKASLKKPESKDEDVKDTKEVSSLKKANGVFETNGTEKKPLEKKTVAKRLEANTTDFRDIKNLLKKTTKKAPVEVKKTEKDDSFDKRPEEIKLRKSSDVELTGLKFKKPEEAKKAELKGEKIEEPKEATKKLSTKTAKTEEPKDVKKPEAKAAAKTEEPKERAISEKIAIQNRSSKSLSSA
uniref:Uncharacterized protein n=1 Tax=Cacopsylla melanoneura TaxID=428564 RepID=A0A8D8UKS6_9HEMI